ncbi:MAG: hypothetical protein Q7S34_03300 [bacterium]|nr:hypothetical protein [bacterium]
MKNSKKKEITIADLAKVIVANSNSISRLEKTVENLAIMTANRFDRMDGRVDGITGRLDAIEGRVNLNNELLQKLRHEFLDLGMKFVPRSEFERFQKEFREFIAKMRIQSKK